MAAAGPRNRAGGLAPSIRMEGRGDAKRQNAKARKVRGGR